VNKDYEATKEALVGRLLDILDNGTAELKRYADGSEYILAKTGKTYVQYYAPCGDSVYVSASHKSEMKHDKNTIIFNGASIKSLSDKVRLVREELYGEMETKAMKLSAAKIGLMLD
jgi:hypothetical protein